MIFVLQDWVTIDGNGIGAFTQARSAWLDFQRFSDATFWLEVRAVTNPSGGNVTLDYETAPAADESLFQSMSSITLAASSTPVVRTVQSSINAAVPIGRWIRWKLRGTQAGSWSVTFRVLATAGRGTSGFTPQSLSGLEAWYRADLGLTLDGNGGVQQWDDQSGRGDSNRNLTSTPTTRPQHETSNSSYGGRAVITFASSSYLVSGTWSASQSPPYTICAVGNVQDSTTNRYFSDTASGQRVALLEEASAGAAVLTNAANPWTGIHLTSPSIFLFESTGSATANLYVSSLTAALSGATVENTAFQNLVLGAYQGLTLQPDGPIAEYIVYSRVLSTSERTSLMQYLSARYAITLV